MTPHVRRALAALALALLPLGGAAGARWSADRDGDVWWLLRPDGARFFSIGVNVVDAEPERAPRRGTLQYGWSPAYASPQAWVEATRGRLLAWGFNTLGGWSRREAEFEMPYTPVLSFGQQVNAIWGDPFDPATPQRMADEAQRRVARHPGGPLRIGYYTDNEVGWWNAPLLLWFLRQDPENSTRKRLVAFLRERYASFAEFRRDFVVPDGVESFDELARRPVRVRIAAGGGAAPVLRAWTGIVVGRYYEMAEQAVRTADPNALVLGDRLPIYWDEDALRAIGRHVDVLAVNHDVATPGGWVAPYFFEGLRDLVPAPVLVSEWFFASRENRTGNANRGQLMTVATQAERARGAAAAARRFAGFPNVVGLHWFQLADQPPGGRSDGEDYSHGLVDVKDAPYEEFTGALAAVNRTLPELHAAARWASPRDPGAPLAIPRSRVASAEAPLDDWDLAATRLHFARGAPGLDVPFADVHLAWTNDSLLVAAIGQDFFDLDLYERSEVAADDALALHLVVSAPAEAGARELRHVVIRLLPARLQQAPDFPPSEHDVEVYVPQGAVVSQDGGAAVGEPQIRARRLRAIAPRFDAVIEIPRPLLGLGAGRPAGPIEIEVAMQGFLRGRAFTLSGRPFARALREPPVVRAELAEAADASGSERPSTSSSLAEGRAPSPRHAAPGE